MARWCGFLFLCAYLILILTSCGFSAQMPSYLLPLQKIQALELINQRELLARSIAEAVQDSVLGIQEGPSQTIISLSLERLKKNRNASYSDGIIFIRANGHAFRIYLLFCGACVHPSLNLSDNLLILTIRNSALPENPRDIYESGRYRVFMVEDGLITWAWDLQPAFRDAPLPEDGGFDPGEAFLVSETRRRLKECQ